MPEPLKNLYTKQLVSDVARAITDAHPAFDTSAFQRHVFGRGWKSLELKGRMRRITEALTEYLPEDFEESSTIIREVVPRFKGFEYMFFPEYVELNGLKHFKVSIETLAAITEYSSAEFAVRPFIVQYGDRMMKTMNTWARSKNYHVRRLASEGCRPRLPWAMALPDFKRDPSPILPILERLRNDSSEYVRRSVANNLNDISKDNPGIALTRAQEWHGHTVETDWVVKHACRTLLKQGDPKTMALFGYAAPKSIQLQDFTVANSVKVGERLPFSFTLVGKRRSLGRIRIEYAVHFRLKNGAYTRKVFKISEGDVAEHEKHVEKSHSFKPITTRVYYPGEHQLEIIVNGVGLGMQVFRLD